MAQTIFAVAPLLESSQRATIENQLVAPPDFYIIWIMSRFW